MKGSDHQGQGSVSESDIRAMDVVSCEELLDHAIASVDKWRVTLDTVVESLVSAGDSVSLGVPTEVGLLLYDGKRPSHAPK